jgi:hypothetical protein
MKKTYISPTAKVIILAPEMLLADSTLIVDDEGNYDVNETFRVKGTVWDDNLFDDEETDW